MPLSRYLYQVYSQNNEDGMLMEVFKAIGVRNSYYVEIGTQSGVECNTRMFRENYGWRGLMLDGGHEDHGINLRKEFVTADNINDLLAKYEVPHEFDLLSIDIDGQDWYVWKSVRFNPRVVIIEYYQGFGHEADLIMPYNPSYQWLGGLCGASLMAMARLGEKKGYTLVGGNLVNCIFVRNDVLPVRPFVHQGDPHDILKNAAHHCSGLSHPLFQLINWDYILANQAQHIQEAVASGYRPSSDFF